MRSPITISLLLLYVICSGIVYIAYGHHQAEELRKAEALGAFHGKLRLQCKLAWPRSPANQIHCFEESKNRS